ncbi:MAG: hypothetical protein U9O56_05620 [Campylobacterota bacterium]|nr:hypothetical protein [Campylobacterota bacterium]
MKIKYAGPRPFINHHGISFKDGKEDKYVYLMISIQILSAIDKNYETHHSYSYDIGTKRLDDEEMYKIMTSYEPKLYDIAQQEAISYASKLDLEIDDVYKNKTLSDIEKEAWIENLKIMKDYRTQRAINKIYYMHAIEYIYDVIKREHIKEIDTPFFEKYWHVLQTIEGKFSNTKSPISTTLKVEPNKDGELIAKMRIVGY